MQLRGVTRDRAEPDARALLAEALEELRQLRLLVARLTSPAQPIERLSPTQARLVAMLARRPGLVFARDLIMDALYAGTEGAEPGILTVYTCLIRRRRPDIQLRCVPGLGIAIDPPVPADIALAIAPHPPLETRLNAQ